MGHFTVPFLVVFLVTLSLDRAGKLQLMHAAAIRLDRFFFVTEQTWNHPEMARAPPHRATLLPYRNAHTNHGCRLPRAFQTKTRGDADGNGGVTEDE
jgi:uncharacterized membrane protein